MKPTNHRTIRHAAICALCACMILVTGCAPSAASDAYTTTPESTATTPPPTATATPVPPTATPTLAPAGWPTDGWVVSPPELQDVDARRLEMMLEEIEDKDYTIDGIVVIRHGYLVFEAYPGRFNDVDDRHGLFSVTKSFTSTLIGIALDQGYIESLDQPMLDFYPTYREANQDPLKEQITIRHMLTMTTGFECVDTAQNGWAGIRAMQDSGNWTNEVLNWQMDMEPGIGFNYCNGVSHLLSGVISEATGMSMLEFAQENLFGPLGITNLEWPDDPQGITYGFSDLRITPRDMAKLGYLYLQGGEWDGQQIVSREYVEAASARQIVLGGGDGYGYQWWTSRRGYYQALGWLGQIIAVIPDKDMVVVFTATLDDADGNATDALIKDFIIPAAR